MPLFALANAGVPLGRNFLDLLANPTAIGVAVGLVLGKQVGVSLFAWLAVRSGIARLPERHYDIFMVFRINYDLESTLTVPDNFKVLNIPDPISIDNRYVTFKQLCMLDGASIICNRRFTIKTRTIPLSDYRQFREICGKIDAAEAQDIVLGPKR